jgi:transposase
MSKLTARQVAAIRRSTKPARELAERYGVSTPTIYDIRNGHLHRRGKSKPARKGIGRPRSRPTEPTNECACGCGTKVWRTWAPGHNFNDSEWMATKHCPANLPWTDERWLTETMARTVEEDRGHETPCMIWTGALDPKTGYAKSKRNGKTQTRHRLVFQITNDVTLPSDLHVDHLCGQRACLNPDHLEPVTPAVNIQRATSKLTEADVRFIRYSGWSPARLAEKFGMHPGSIYNIRSGFRWANVV